MDIIFFVLLVVFAILEITDTATTRYILDKLGGYEKNKWMRWIVASPLRSWVFCVLLVCLVSLFMVAIRTVLGDLVVIPLLIAIVFKAKPVIHNIKVILRET